MFVVGGRLRRPALVSEWRAAEGDLLEDGDTHRLWAQLADGASDPMTLSRRARNVVLDSISHVARVDPAALAVVDRSGSWTYGDLSERALVFAHALADLGVAKGQPVALMGLDSPNAIAAVVALVGAGHPYVPLARDYPPARVNEILAAVGAQALVQGQTHRDEFGRPVAGTEVTVANEVVVTAIKGQASSLLDESVAYVLYTSGSTGTPKGFVMSAEAMLRNVVRESCRAERRLSLRSVRRAAAPTRVLQCQPLSFAFSVQEIFSSLLLGDCLVPVAERRRQDMEHVLRVVQEAGATRAYLTPLLLTALAEVWPNLGGSVPLTEFVVAGGKLRLTPAIRAFLSVAADPVVESRYGAGEANDVASKLLCGSPSTWDDLPTVGAGVECYSMHLLQEHSRDPADVGEIHVEGDAFSYGYLNDPRRTAERFVPDPFSGRRGARMYRSGDGGQWLGAELFVLGRLDDEVKIRGYRVLLSDIDAALREVPGIREAAAATVGDEWEARVCAVVVPDGLDVPSPDSIRAMLSERWPSYLLPTDIAVVQQLPLNRNGKVDRSAVAAAAAAGPSEPLDVAPLDPEAREVIAAWSGVLGRPPTTMDDDFFVSGGTSLLATRLVVGLRERLGRAIPFGLPFESPVLRQLISGVRSAMSPIVSPPQHIARQSARASLGQHGLWFLEQAEPSSYNVVFGYRIAGELSIDTLSAAVAAFGARHDAFRTRFELDGSGALRQCVRDSIDRDVVTVESAPHDLIRLTRRLLHERLDLASGSLFRAFVLPSHDHIDLVMQTHHLVFDRWSMTLFEREVSEFYAARLSGRRPSVAPLALSIRDHAEWQHEVIAGDALDRQVQYWREALAGLSDVGCGSLKPRNENVDTYWIPIDGELYDHIEITARREGASEFSMLLSAFSKTLADLGFGTEFCVGIPVRGRPFTDLEGIVGYFVNTLPIWVQANPSEQIALVHARLRRRLYEALSNQDVPHETIARTLAEQGRWQPLLRGFFDVDLHPVELVLENRRAERLPVPAVRARFDVEAVVHRTATGGLGEIVLPSGLANELGPEDEFESVFTANLGQLVS